MRNNGKLQIDRESYFAQRNRMNYLVSQAKRPYHTRLIVDCGYDLPHCLHWLTAIPWLKHSVLPLKVKKIRDSLSLNVVLCEPEPVNSFTLKTFQHTTAEIDP